MVNYREILRLHSLGQSQRTIRSSAHCSDNTVRTVLEVASQKGIQWPLDDDITNADLERMLFPDKYKSACLYIEPDYPYIHRELAKHGVTLTLLLEEYRRKCYDESKKPYIACALGNSACRKFRTVKYIRMPELLDELTVAKDNGEFKKVIDAYKKVDLLILDEWLIRRLTPAESYIMPEIAEARCKRSMIFCTQYEPEGWYERINPDPESESPISEAIMDRIIHNSFIMPIDGRISMRERYGVSSEVES